MNKTKIKNGVAVFDNVWAITWKDDGDLYTELDGRAAVFDTRSNARKFLNDRLWSDKHLLRIEKVTVK